jgi:hypothetical protein
MQRASELGLLALLCGSLAGCSEGFDSPSKVQGLRAFAVRAEPASGVPGQSATLELLRGDRQEADGEPEREVEVAWLGGCHAPPSRQFFDCYPLLVEVAKRLEPRVLDTPEGRFPSGIFGSGDRFQIEIPEDVLERTPKLETDPVHFAPSFTFFAVCAGELVPRPELTDRVPLGCVSKSTGEPVSTDDFVIGFSTLYTLEGATNQNPELRGLRFDGGLVTSASCDADADCEPLEGAPELEMACAPSSRCAPVVPVCAEGCPGHQVLPLIARSSAERLPNEDYSEVVWANFFANAGEFGKEAQLVNDRASGWVSEFASKWKPPKRPGTARIWVTVNDQRGGAAWSTFDVIVR